MNIKELSISNNQKKRVLASISDQQVVFQDENGDVVVNVEAYITLKDRTNTAPVEELLGLEALETLGDNIAYVIFQ